MGGVIRLEVKIRSRHSSGGRPRAFKSLEFYTFLLLSSLPSFLPFFSPFFTRAEYFHFSLLRAVQPCYTRHLYCATGAACNSARYVALGVLAWLSLGVAARLVISRSLVASLHSFNARRSSRPPLIDIDRFEEKAVPRHASRQGAAN